MRQSRKGNKQQESSGQDNWLTTYSDMVTLLLCFFVLLFSMSTIDVEKFTQVVMSLQEALNGVLLTGSSVSPSEIAGQVDDTAQIEKYMQEMQQLQSTHNNLQSYLRQEGLTDSITVMFEDRGLLIRFADNILFSGGAAQLEDGAMKLLDKVAVVINELPNDIIVEGHTDNLPLINTNTYPSNWELSTARATTVAKYFLENQFVDPHRVGIAGYGQYRPVANNNTVEGRRNNRRVDVVIKRLSLQ